MREIVENFFADAQWPVQSTLAPGGMLLETRFQGGNGAWRLLVEVREDEEILAIYSVLDVMVSLEQRRVVTELLTRINLTRPVGNFDLDYERGTISYRTGADVSGGILTVAMVENLIYINGLTVDRYLPGIVEVLFGGEQPELVLQNLEQKLTDPEN